MSFAEEAPVYDKSETQNRTGAAYVKFDEAYRVTLRVLDPQARTVWKHYIEQANDGKGTSVVCPNTTAQTKVCPIEQSVEGLPKDDVQRKAANARKRFVTNVLDRTPYTTCNTCQTFTPGNNCISCGSPLKGHDFKPLNKVKILEGGPRLFIEQLNNIERMQKQDFNKDIVDYDIVFTTTGRGRDKKIAALPRAVEALDASVMLDAETGEPQKVYDLDLLTEPTSIEEIKLNLQGVPFQEILAVRNAGIKEIGSLPF